MLEEVPAQFKAPGVVVRTEQKKAPTPQSIELAGGIENYMKQLEGKNLPPEQMSEKVIQIFQLLTQLNETEQVQFGQVIERMMQLPKEAELTPVMMPGVKSSELPQMPKAPLPLSSAKPPLPRAA